MKNNVGSYGSIAHAIENDDAGMSPGYTLQRVSLSDCEPGYLTEWQEFLDRHESSMPQHNPAWLTTHFADRSDKVSVYLLYESGSICGVAPFAYADWPLEWHIGEFRVAKVPLRRIYAIGGIPDFPDDEAAWDLLFRELATSAGPTDTLYLDGIPVESFLWKYIDKSSMIRRTFRPYQPQPPTCHYMLYLGSSFEAYMATFSSKHRKNLSREVRRIREGDLGSMQFNRYTTPGEVPAFVELAQAVSRKTWQWKLLGHGVGADEGARRRLAVEAENGWLRSYILLCGGRPLAYIVGFQYGARFVFHEIGSDPEFANKSLGTVILVLTIEDLFGQRRAQVMDLGRAGPYKEAFTKDSVLEGTKFLFYPGAYAGFVRSGHRICQTISICGSRMLEKLDLKETMRKAIRKVSTRS